MTFQSSPVVPIRSEDVPKSLVPWTSGFVAPSQTAHYPPHFSFILIAHWIWRVTWAG